MSGIKRVWKRCDLLGVRPGAEFTGIGCFAAGLKEILISEGVRCNVRPKSVINILKQVRLTNVALFLSDEFYLPLAFMASRLRCVFLAIHDARRLRRLRWFIKLAWFMADASNLHILYASAQSKREVLDAMPEFRSFRSTVVYNPITVLSGAPSFFEMASNWHQEDIQFFYIGSFEARKRFDKLVEFSKYTSRPVIVRTSRFYFERFSLAHTYKDQRFKFDLDFPLEKLFRFDDGLPVFITFSEYEGFGRPYIEAQALGIPVVCTENNVTEEILHGSGICIPAIELSDISSAFVDKVERDVLLHYEKLVLQGKENYQRFSLNKFRERIKCAIEDTYSNEL